MSDEEVVSGMKIAGIETFQLSAPLDRPFGWSQGWIGHRSVGLVKVTTDDGVVGWGEGCGGAAAAVVENDFGPMLIGEDPMNRIGLWQKMFAMQYNANVAVGLGGSAISAVDTALWDIAGKALGQPVYQLLGGRARDKVAVYATGLYYTEGEFPTRLLEEARGYVEAGFRGMKTKVGGLPMDEDVKRVAALRETIGPDIKLMVDANQTYNATSAIRIGSRLADLDILWFEEPVNAQDIEGYLQVKSALPMAIAGGENLRTRYEFSHFLSRRAYDIAQPDVINVGGVTEMRNVAMTANTQGIQVNPHVWGSPVMIAASLHVASTIPPCPPSGDPEPYVQEPVMEFDRTPSRIREGLMAEPFDQKDGFLAVPDGPGLGVEIDEKAVRQLSV
ncbi:MAG: mandelate racemase/muconate lactonizing enzyme family protein [Dehalococcoidia bacterium]|nr:mandelate racemase/muconate lactonizing enzyme family protein [Dehalococcoidia bacterium]